MTVTIPCSNGLSVGLRRPFFKRLTVVGRKTKLPTSALAAFLLPLIAVSPVWGRAAANGTFSTSWYIDLFIVIALAAMGVYNCVIFVMRRSDRSPLYFGTFCMLIAFNNFISNSGTSFISDLFPASVVLPLRKADIATIVASIPCFVMFVNAFYPRLGSRMFQRVLQSTALLFLAGTAAFSGARLELLFCCFFPVIFVAIGYCIVIGIRAITHHQSDAHGVLTGVAVLSVAGVNDVLWGYGLPHTSIVVPYATLVFTLIYSALISRRFSMALTSAEQLNAELLENRRLREEMRKQLTQEQDLRLAQRRLTGLLHSIVVPLCALSEAGVIVFCNRAFEELAGKPLSQLLGTTPDDYINLKKRKSHSTTVSLDLEDEQLSVLLFESSETGPASGSSAVQFVESLNKNRARIRSLETLLTTTNPDMVKSNPELRHDIESIDTALAQISSLLSNDKSAEQRIRLGIEVLCLAIDCWTECTSTTKFELAEESGLWKVHTNPDGWRRTQTLDRYLHVATFPQNPRWNRIFKTADFVLMRCRMQGDTRTRLETAVQNLSLAAELAR